MKASFISFMSKKEAEESVSKGHPLLVLKITAGKGMKCVF